MDTNSLQRIKREWIMGHCILFIFLKSLSPTYLFLVYGNTEQNTI
jgi:hypothetical protein